ncbi:DUF1365 domain-containing protein [[Mycobacterium] burgundiense]|uniref:DUF1365 family protein n=1 Tax=[Mycobacterium] burgundiense TaxID=3064286 RepID=A0ABN9N1P2_9MYCO|nr:DUF1365 family protein [Mycolicibacterium sp. MU0053]CAJ1496944.1 DUF1365 family protein [Mycolicibacterium sp. MU0053]
MSTAAIYRTRTTHLRRAPVHHHFEHRGYCWYLDIDAPPRLPALLRPFARFRPADHLQPPGSGPDTLRRRVDTLLAGHGIDLRGGQVTALMQARVLGFVFNPLSIFWCHDRDGRLRAVIAEVHNTYGQRHAYLLPADQDRSTPIPKRMYVSPFNGTDGYYLVRAPQPEETLNVRITLHRDDHPAFVATLQGHRQCATPARIAWLQLSAPLAPLLVAWGIRVQGILLWLRRVPIQERP